MAALLTTATLAKWTQNDDAEVAGDPFAVDLIDKMSQLICFIGGHDGTKVDSAGATIPEWTLDAGAAQAPIDVQMVALQVIKRSYENPGRVIQEGSIGPLGGDRVDDVQALFAEFTDAERATLARYNVDGDPTGPGEGAGTVFVMRIDNGSDLALSDSEILYAGDDQQINLGPEDSAYPEWQIPMFNPNDPGGQG
jgi:hypothetical protein